MKYEVKIVQNVYLLDTDRIINCQDQGWDAMDVSEFNTMTARLFRWEEIETDSIKTYVEAFNKLFAFQGIEITEYQIINMSAKKAEEFITHILVELGVTER